MTVLGLGRWCSALLACVFVWLLLGPRRAAADAAQPARLRIELEGVQLVIYAADRSERLATLALALAPRAFVSVGAMLYVARRERGVASYDLRDPRAPRQVAEFGTDLVVAKLRVLGDVLQLRSPSGSTLVAYRMREAEPPTLLLQLRTFEEADDAEWPEGAGALGETRHGGEPAWLSVRLRDGSGVIGLPQPASTAEYLVLRLPGRAILTVLRSEIVLCTATPAPPADAAAEIPRSLRAEGTAQLPPQEVSAAGGQGQPTAVSDRLYVVDGSQLAIYRQRVAEQTLLGATRLPWVGRQPPIVAGRAAYVLLPYRGIAVVDIGLSRFPYVLWHLLPQQTIRRARLDGHLLRVTADSGQVVYDLAEPLRPQGRERYPVQPPRRYPDDDERPSISDEAWQDQGRLWSAAGRRIYLTDGSHIVGRWTRTTSDGITLDVQGQPRVIARADIVHSEPVELDSSPLPADAAQRSLPKTSSGVRAGRALLLGGATILAIGQIVAIVGAVALVISVPFWFRIPIPVRATEPQPSVALRPAAMSAQSLPPPDSGGLLRVRF